MHQPEAEGQSLELDASHQDKDEEDHHHHAENARGAIAPIARIGPGRNGADEEKNQDDEQNG